MQLLGRAGVEGQLQLPVVPAPWLTNQLGWEVPGVLTDRLQQAVGPVAVELEVAFPCPSLYLCQGKNATGRGNSILDWNHWICNCGKMTRISIGKFLSFSHQKLSRPQSVMGQPVADINVRIAIKIRGGQNPPREMTRAFALRGTGGTARE